LLLVVTVARVEIVGAPVACADGVKDTWRDLAAWVATQLEGRYGDAVRVTYHDLFDADAPSLPPDAALPIVLVNGSVVTNGGKLSVPLIRRAIEALGVASERSPVSSAIRTAQSMGAKPA
jgi:disulfide oxidoreductase YuzD